MMISTILITVLALPTALVVWSAISLQTNLAKAKAAGFPVLVRYITPTNPLWMAFGSKLVRLFLRLGLTTKDSAFTRFYLFGWEANERYRVHAELGDAFMVVSPGGNWLYVANPDAAWDMMKRPADFVRNTEQLAVLNVYGKNLSTTDGAEWQKHRKVTSTTFTEKNNELVWKSSLSQAKGMLEYWTQRAPQPVRTVAEDAKTFTLNVLAAALFSKPYPFEGRQESKLKNATGEVDVSYLYRDSLSKILSNIIVIFIFGGEKLKNSTWLPKSWQEAGDAVATFKNYVVSLIEQEKENYENGVHNRNDLVAALVRSTMMQKKEGRDMTFTEQDIISNTFVYAFAGNDTTAITLAHMIVNLAAHPETQAWIAEEIRHYYPEKDSTGWAYSNWSKLKRCQAVAMESLRLCHPLGSSSKLPSGAGLTLKVNDQTYTVPADTNLQVNFCALHTNTSFWGSNSVSWDPTRFIYTANGASPTFENELLKPDTEKHFMPWSSGQRICPGKKFSQVELAATMAVLFQRHTLEPVPEKGESLGDARRRAQHVSLDIQQTLLNEMFAPESLGLIWKEVA